jgi:uncharacterized protein
LKQVVFRFYAELNDFLPSEKKDIPFVHSFLGSPTVKDRIESIGVPHAEVDLILVNGNSVGFDYQVVNEDEIRVYPACELTQGAHVSQVRPKPLRKIRFIVDENLGRLAVYLRMFGFDAVCEKRYSDPDLAEISWKKGRILLTRDIGVLKRKSVIHGYWVRQTDPRLQLGEVLKRFDLLPLKKPFQRCIRCNELLKSVTKEEVLNRIPPKTQTFFDEFFFCGKCERVYWKGSHFQKMEQWVMSYEEDHRDLSRCGMQNA